MPLFLCSPSQFWLTRYLRMPRFDSSASAIWVGVGIACNVLTVLEVRCLPWALNVHTPSGPRKSGIPVLAQLELRTMAKSVFWNPPSWPPISHTGGSGDTGAGESDKVLASSYLVCQSVRLSLHYIRSFNTFFDRDLGGCCGHDSLLIFRTNSSICCRSTE